ASTPPFLLELVSERSLVPPGRAGARAAASSVAPVASGYERDAASLHRDLHRSRATKRHSETSSSSRWQAATRPPSVGRSGGGSGARRSIATGQGVWRARPAGGARGEGISPASRCVSRRSATWGTDRISACV